MFSFILDIINIRNEKKCCHSKLLLLLLLLLLYDLTFYGFRIPNKMNINVFKVFKSSFLQKHKSLQLKFDCLHLLRRVQRNLTPKRSWWRGWKNQNQTTPKNSIKTFPVCDDCTNNLTISLANVSFNLIREKSLWGAQC